MKVHGQQSLRLDPQAAWDLLLNTDVLARAMPGCESLVPVGPDEYEMRMKVVMSSIQGLFAGKVRIEEKNPPTSYRLTVTGDGKLGYMKGSGLLTLSPEDSGTLVTYEGEIQIGGRIASVGERMMDLTAKMLIRRFFNNLQKETGVAGDPASA